MKISVYVIVMLNLVLVTSLSGGAQIKRISGIKDRTVDQIKNHSEYLPGLTDFGVDPAPLISPDSRMLLPKNNTLLFFTKYTKESGSKLLYPINDGPGSVQNPHFTIEDSTRKTDFIRNNSYPVIVGKNEEEYFTLRNGLTNTFNRIKMSEPLTVAFVGGSITWGPGWRDKITLYLKETFPNSEFRFINAGVPSLGSLPHAFRLQNEVLSHGRIDLMFYESAVNDRVNNTDSIIQLRALEGIVRQARKSNPMMDIIFMSFSDQYKNKDFDKGILPYEILNHELVAEYYDLPSVNLAKEIYDRQLSGEFSWKNDFKDLHPSPFGQELYFSSLKRLMQSALTQWQQVVNQSKNFSLPVKLRPPLDKFNLSAGTQLSIHEALPDKRWTIVKNWVPLDGKPGREGYFNRSVLLANEPEAECSLVFKGTTAGMAILSGPDAGILCYSIDNQAYKTVDLYTEWSHMLHLPWFLLFESDLEDTQHILKIKISPNKNSSSIGHACRILYFLINRG